MGITFDKHLTLATQVDNTVKKCNGLLGMLHRASPLLPKELLKLSYTALIRSRLEYCSSLYTSTAKTHLNKLDVIQRKAARIISHLPRDAHSEPLLKTLKLESLDSRRDKHTLKIIKACVEGKCHPALKTMFTHNLHENQLTIPNANKSYGKRRFSIAGAKLYNKDLKNKENNQH